MTIKNRFSESDMKAFAPSEKVGIIATVTPEGLPHLSLLTSVMASTPTQLTIGEFSTGVSKAYLQQTRKTGFAIVTLDKKLWRGKALWTHLKKEGPEYEVYNQQPMFRYNTYFGINTVHYLELKETTEGSPLPLVAVAASAILTRIAKGAAAQSAKVKALSPFGKNLFDRLDSLKFLSFIDDDGFPTVIPVIQCQACDENRLAFYPGVFAEELNRLEAGKTMAIFGMTMEMEDVLVRGVFQGYARRRGIRLGTLDIDWVYNSMPPNHGQIHPPLPLKAVTDF